MSNQDAGTGQDITNGATGEKTAPPREYKKRKQKQQSKIRQFFAPAGDTNTDNATDSDDDIEHESHTENKIEQHPPPLSTSTNVGSWGGDKID
eukprot:14679291-Ditylum_brightwellii.AAC.1